MGWKEQEKLNYEDFGYHNYKEFINDIQNLVNDHFKTNLITVSIKLSKKKYVQSGNGHHRLLDNHDITIDFSQYPDANDMFSGILTCNGRKMYEDWKVTRDIGECIDNNVI